MTRTLEFSKGHGTYNDFVLLRDRMNLNPVSSADVRFLCDRRAGVGGDGLLRAVQADKIDDWHGPGDVWFMDYRNADGSIAEMCGNGLRVFARYLISSGLVPSEPFLVATRAGLRQVSPGAETIKVSMGPVRIARRRTWVSLAGCEYRASAVNVGNPHAVVLLDPGFDLSSLDLSVQPNFDHDVFPNGANIEFVSPSGPATVAMRVHERGVGETMSCGTGVVAAAAVFAGQQPATPIEVRVPGGVLRVDLGVDEAELTGPAVIVAKGVVELPEASK